MCIGLGRQRRLRLKASRTAERDRPVKGDGGGGSWRRPSIPSLSGGDSWRRLQKSRRLKLCMPGGSLPGDALRQAVAGNT
jgi:hypothetical protein